MPLLKFHTLAKAEDGTSLRNSTSVVARGHLFPYPRQRRALVLTRPWMEPPLPGRAQLQAYQVLATMVYSLYPPMYTARWLPWDVL